LNNAKGKQGDGSDNHRWLHAKEVGKRLEHTTTKECEGLRVWAMRLCQCRLSLRVCGVHLSLYLYR
jgi:hypothetical protein